MTKTMKAVALGAVRAIWAGLPLAASAAAAADAVQDVVGILNGQPAYATVIRYQERNPGVHYMVYLDGEYANMLLSDAARSPKLERQYQDIVNCLTENPQNYFVNPSGFVKFLAELRVESATPFQAE